MAKNDPLDTAIAHAVTATKRHAAAMVAAAIRSVADQMDMGSRVVASGPIDVTSRPTDHHVAVARDGCVLWFSREEAMRVMINLADAVAHPQGGGPVRTDAEISGDQDG